MSGCPPRRTSTYDFDGCRVSPRYRLRWTPWRIPAIDFLDKRRSGHSVWRLDQAIKSISYFFYISRRNFERYLGGYGNQRIAPQMPMEADSPDPPRGRNRRPWANQQHNVTLKEYDVKKHFHGSTKFGAVALSLLLLVTAGCDDDLVGSERFALDDPPVTVNTGGPVNDDVPGGQGSTDLGAILLVIDEDCIDNGNPPNGFSDVDVNDQMAEVGVRSQLRYFSQNIGRTIDLYTGEVGDEGWHSLKTIPSSWISAGPTDNGAMNFVLAGPGLGSRNRDDDREAYLDKIPDVTPLRATGLRMLVGQIILAVVYDSDVSINYSPLLGSLKGANLGLVALRVIDVRERRDGSTGSLPTVTVEILDSDNVQQGRLYLFANAPVPRSSSEPYDVAPPKRVSGPRLELAR